MRELDESEMRVLKFLATRQEKKWFSVTTIRNITLRTGLTTNQVGEALRGLETKRLVKRKKEYVFMTLEGERKLISSEREY